VTPTLSYLVCATGRSGSNLLCGLLRGTGVAGRPEEFFFRGHEPCWARRWGASGPVEYVHEAMREGTRNGVFGAKVMWFHMPNLLAKLEAVQGQQDVDERTLLESAFPGLRFVWIRRDDVVAQAVSCAKAMQTDQWTAVAPRHPDRVPRFDFAQIHRLVNETEEQNAAWRRWFRRNGIAPFDVRYEDLVADMEGVTRRLLEFLGVAMPTDTPIEPKHARQADSVNAEWAARYRQMVL
jgi:trehalose 2-sulfotransferase